MNKKLLKLFLVKLEKLVMQDNFEDRLKTRKEIYDLLKKNKYFLKVLIETL